MPSLYSAIKHGTGGSRMRLMLVFHLVFIHAMSDHCRVSWCKATNLAECILGWWGVAPTSVPVRNVIEGVGCVQTFAPAMERHYLSYCHNVKM